MDWVNILPQFENAFCCVENKSFKATNLLNSILILYDCTIGIYNTILFYYFIYKLNTNKKMQLSSSAYFTIKTCNILEFLCAV